MRTLSIVVLLLLSGCAPAKNKSLSVMSGVKSDGIVEMGYEHGAWGEPDIDPSQGIEPARARCKAWGYKDAEQFGGKRRQCTDQRSGGCARWLVTVSYQCTN